MTNILVSIFIGTIVAWLMLRYMGAWRQPPPETNKLLRQIGQDGSMWQRRPWFVLGSFVVFTTIFAMVTYTLIVGT